MRKFKEQMAREIPAWIQKGWLTRQNADEILKSIPASDPKCPNKLVFSLLILGVILLGAGVITFFAAHWTGMAKIVKIALLFGGMWISYGLSSWFLENRPDSSIWQAFLLLGIIQFGSNIYLIAQIYHIDAHYPNGILLWAFGALFTAFMMEAQAPVYPAIGLSVLWAGFETIGFDRLFFWQFLILWIAILFTIYKNGWKPAAHAAMAGLLIWSLMEFFHYSLKNSASIPLITGAVFLAYSGLFLLGKVTSLRTELSLLSSPFQKYSLGASLFFLYLLTFPPFYDRSIAWEQARRTWPANETIFWNIFFPGLVGLNILLMVWYLVNREPREDKTLLGSGCGILFVVLFLIGLPFLKLNGIELIGDGNLTAILFNLIFFGALVWLVYYGVRNQENFTVNTSFAFFALILVSRYFDTFWSLLNRSYFFMLGGLLLIGGGFFLERQRRKLTRKTSGNPGKTR